MALFTIPAEEINADRNHPLGKSPRRTTDVNVFRGSWNGSLVAVKVLRTETVIETLLERHATWQSLRHPHVLQVFGVSLIDAGPPTIISQYLPNGAANEYIINNPAANRANIMLDCALGLQYLHSRGLVHGSLKPSNILVAEDGKACVADYGMAEIAPSGNTSSHRYYSPEAWKGTISKPSDVFSFAMCSYEIFFSIPPWGVLGEELIYRLVVREGERPDRLDLVPEQKGGITDHQWQIIERAWQQGAALRPTFTEIVKLWQTTTSVNSRSLETPPLRSNSSSSTNSDRSPPTPFGVPATAENPSRRSPDMVSVSSVPPAYLERYSSPPILSSPLSSEHFHGPSTTNHEGYAGSLHAVARPMEDPASRDPRPITLPPTAPSPTALSPTAPQPTALPPTAPSPTTSTFNHLPIYPMAMRVASFPNSEMTSEMSPNSNRTSFADGGSIMQGPSHVSRMQSIYEREPTSSIREPYAPSFMARGPAYNGDPHWNSQRLSTSEGHRMMPDMQSMAGDSQRGAPQNSIGRNAVLLAKALLAEVKEGRKREVIDDYLDKARFLCQQSAKEAQKLVTAGVVPTVLLLLQSRAIDGVGLELVLVTLGILACDPITANTVHRTNTATVLVEIVSSSDSENIIALAVWCLNRICRSAEVAESLVKLDLANILISKGMQGGLSSSRLSSWCLGTLAYTDALAQTLASYNFVTESTHHLKLVSMDANASTEDICAALYAIARLARTIPLSKQLIRAGCVPLVVHHLSNSEDPQILQWSARAVGCMMRPNGSDIAKTLIEAGSATALARMPRVLPSDVIEPLAAFAFSITRFSAAEWGGGTRKALVDAGVVDSLLAALRTAADTLYPQVHIELALAVSSLGDVGGSSLRKEIVKAGGVDILKRVSASGRADVSKACNLAVTTITGNLWTRNAAAAKTAMSHSWNGGCPEYQPPCPLYFNEEFQ